MPSDSLFSSIVEGQQRVKVTLDRVYRTVDRALVRAGV